MLREVGILLFKYNSKRCLSLRQLITNLKRRKFKREMLFFLIIQRRTGGIGLVKSGNTKGGNHRLSYRKQVAILKNSNRYRNILSTSGNTKI